MKKHDFPTKPVSFIFFLLRPYALQVFILALIAIIWAADNSLESYLVKLMLDALEITPKESTNLITQLKVPVVLYISLRVFINIVGRFHDYINLRIMPYFNKKVLILLTKYIQKHSHSYFQSHFGGSIVSKISIIADTTESIFNDLIYSFIYPFFTLALVTLTIGAVHYKFGVILIIWSIIFIIVSYRLSLQVQQLSEQLTEKYTTLVGKLIDNVTNILAVRLYARRKYEVKYLESSAQEKAEKAQELKWNDLKRNAVMEMLANILIGILIYYLILERQKNHITIGDFALVLTLGLSILDIVWDLSRNYIRFVENLGKCSQALATIMVPYEIKDAPEARPLKVQKGIIEFKNVSFDYYGTRLFKNINIKIKENEKVGIVGSSGSGKTTLLNLIARLWDVKEGAILIDGQNIKNITQDSLHQNISFIPQDPLLFSRTVLDNIRYGNLDASEEEVIEAAKYAHAHVFISALPNRYNTFLGEKGATLSGGQRQRIAIARAILKKAKILIMDEATSALDSETEYYIQESFEYLMKNKTVLVVAHRLSTLLKMDRLIVLHEGKVVEEGTHEALLQQRGVYAKLWHYQLRKAASASKIIA